MHAGFLLVNGKKMSKSLKNFITIREFLKKNSADDLRMVVLSHHYRSPIDYNDNVLEQAKNSLNNIQEFLSTLEFLKSRTTNTTLSSSIKARINKFEKKFQAALDDDFNTPKAIAEIFELINKVNPKMWEISKKDADNIKSKITRALDLFGLKTEIPEIPSKIAKLAQKRQVLRRNKQFVPADDLRKQIKRLGYRIEDTPLGPLVQKVNPNFKS